ncbi:MAG: hypothetical protein V1738_04065 [Patescibacteria group bacterium]
MSSFGKKLWQTYAKRHDTTNNKKRKNEVWHNFLVNNLGPALEEYIDLPATAENYAISMLSFMTELGADDDLIDFLREESGEPVDEILSSDEMREVGELMQSILSQGIEVYYGRRDAFLINHLDELGMTIGIVLQMSRSLIETADEIVDQAIEMLGEKITVGDIWLNFDLPSPPI